MSFFKKENLITYKLSIDGMRCGMCETHINDIVRKNFDVKKVKSSHFKNETIIVSKSEIDLRKLKAVIESTGYIVKEIERRQV